MGVPTEPMAKRGAGFFLVLSGLGLPLLSAARQAGHQRIALTVAAAAALLFGTGAAASGGGHMRQVCAKQPDPVKCVRQHTAWPVHPSLPEVRNRMSAVEWDSLRWICRHEQPGRGWNGCWWSAPYTAFVGGLGMAHSTYGIGAAVTGYPYPPAATAAEQMAVGVIVMRKFGPSAWTSWGSR